MNRKIDSDQHSPKSSTVMRWGKVFFSSAVAIKFYHTSANYIVNNPAKWNDDKFFDDNT